MTTSKTNRLYFVDYLRVGLTVLVIAHHAGQAYGPTGGTWPISNPTRSALLGPFFAVNPMFFMGLFFLASGYFVPFVYDRRGAATFLKGRLIRLGVPALFFALFVFGPIGGNNWRSLVFCTWEAFVCAGLGVGLLVLFRELLNGPPSRLLAAIVGAQYGAYIIHLLVALGVQAGLDGVMLAPFIKFVIVTLIAAILSFGIGYGAKKLPGVKKIL
jgi:hypothetical protein